MPTLKPKAKKKTEVAVKSPETSPKQMAVKHVRRFKGTVVSNAMQKTVVVRVDNLKRHPKYNKSYRVSEKFHVHDEEGISKPGEVVEFVECRPLSKTKRWRLVQSA